MKMIIYSIIFLLFFSCSPQKQYEKVKYEEVTIKFVDTLIAPVLEDRITRLEIIITGNINGSAILKIGHQPYDRFDEVELKGVVNKEIDTDWYEKECLIKYFPLEKVQGDSLIIKYRFY